jgi:hypothetical protein
LEHLHLENVCSELPDGLPSQLVKLTCLHVGYSCVCNVAAQFQHLSSFTALQQLKIGCDRSDVAAALPVVGQLSQLTSLELFSPVSPVLEFSSSNTGMLASLTALQELHLLYCKVQPAAVTALTQLRALKCAHVQPLGAATHEEVLLAVSKLTQLTELHYIQMMYPTVDPPPAAAFTALTASTNLCSLRLWFFGEGPLDWVLFRPGLVYPRLHSILTACCSSAPPIGEQQLQQLCSCGPAVESLALRLTGDAASTACLPLLQLSALTRCRWVFGAT